MKTNILPIKIFDSPREAPHYKGSDFKGAEITEAHIVLNGTEGGRATVDFLIEVIDPQTGKTTEVCVAMKTGTLIIGLADAIKGAEAR